MLPFFPRWMNRRWHPYIPSATAPSPTVAPTELDSPTTSWQETQGVDGDTPTQPGVLGAELASSHTDDLSPTDPDEVASGLHAAGTGQGTEESQADTTCSERAASDPGWPPEFDAAHLLSPAEVSSTSSMLHAAPPRSPPSPAEPAGLSPLPVDTDFEDEEALFAGPPSVAATAHRPLLHPDTQSDDDEEYLAACREVEARLAAEPA